MENKLPGYMQCSLDHEKLSKTTKGIILVISGLIVFLISHYTANMTQNQILMFLDQIISTVSAMAMAVGIVVTVYGFLIKMLVMMFSKR